MRNPKINDCRNVLAVDEKQERIEGLKMKLHAKHDTT